MVLQAQHIEQPDMQESGLEIEASRKAVVWVFSSRT